jgi:hypothetical protein
MSFDRGKSIRGGLLVVGIGYICPYMTVERGEWSFLLEFGVSFCGVLLHDFDGNGRRN